MIDHTDCIIEIHELPLDGDKNPPVVCYKVRISEKDNPSPRVLGPYRRNWEAFQALTREGVKEVQYIPTVDLREI